MVWELKICIGTTDGLVEEHRKPCLECWCKDESLASSHPEADDDQHDPTHSTSAPATGKGSFFCCSNCTVSPPADGVEPAPLNYQLQYNVSFRSLLPKEPAKQVELIGFDASGGRIEYQIDVAKGPGSIHTQVGKLILCPACILCLPFTILPAVPRSRDSLQQQGLSVKRLCCYIPPPPPLF